MNFTDYAFETSAFLDKDVIVGNAEQISYPALYREVCRIAAHLNRIAGEDQKILLIGENSVFFVAAYLGIIKSGNVCVPVNPAIGAEALAHIVGQCQAKIGFIQKRSMEKFSPLFEQVFDESAPAAFPEPAPTPPATQNPQLATRNSQLENQDSRFKNQDSRFKTQDSKLDAAFNPSRLAEILFTSGSTALPKGVMLTHGNLIANTESIIEYLKLTEADRIEVVLPFYYCFGLSLLHTHLRVGGSMVLNNTFMMLNTVIEDLQTYQCTGFSGVPSHYQIILRKSRRFKETKFPHLRYVTQAGGKLPVPFIKEFTEAFPEVKFYVMYGQTEATARLSYLPPEMLPAKIGSIGRGIPGVKLEVLNKAGQPVKPGEVGELAASGGNIMAGYFQDPELTARTIRNGKLYTGDLGTVDEDGYIYIVAREKEFIKVGGERVSPKEIEEVIVRLPEVVDCSIIGVPDDLLGEAVKAYIVLNGKNLKENDIIAYCTQHLSSTKIPKYVEFIDKIPVSATGKKEKARLLELHSAT